MLNLSMSQPPEEIWYFEDSEDRSLPFLANAIRAYDEFMAISQLGGDNPKIVEIQQRQHLCEAMTYIFTATDLFAFYTDIAVELVNLIHTKNRFAYNLGAQEIIISAPNIFDGSIGSFNVANLRETLDWTQHKIRQFNHPAEIKQTAIKIVELSKKYIFKEV